MERLKPILSQGVEEMRGREGQRKNAAWKVHAWRTREGTLEPGGIIRTLIVSLLGAAALTAGLLVLRHQKESEVEVKTRIPAGEKTVRIASLERLRELGL